MKFAHCRPATFCLLLAATLAAACGPREPRTDAEKLERGRELVQQMSKRLASADTMRVVSRETRETVKADGSKTKLALGRVTELQRPDRLHSKTTGDRRNELFYDGVGLTLVMHNEKIFGQSRMPETLDGFLDAISERYGASMPLADLVYTDPAHALLTETTKGGYVGREEVAGKRAYHLAFTDEGVEWELWLPTEGEPVPLRMRVVQTARRGQPAADVSFVEWDLVSPVEAVLFDATVPGDYEGVALIQRASIFRNRADSTTPPAGKR